MKVCEWKVSERKCGGEYRYDTDCGKENIVWHRGFEYCPYCGRQLERVDFVFKDFEPKRKYG